MQKCEQTPEIVDFLKVIFYSFNLQRKRIEKTHSDILRNCIERKLKKIILAKKTNYIGVCSASNSSFRFILFYKRQIKIAKQKLLVENKNIKYKKYTR